MKNQQAEHLREAAQRFANYTEAADIIGWLDDLLDVYLLACEREPERYGALTPAAIRSQVANAAALRALALAAYGARAASAG